MYKGYAIEVNGLWAGYGKDKVLTGISFSVEKGEFVGILGPNGSGKTTLLRVLSGVLEPRQGTVKIFGRKILEMRRAQVAAQLAVVPQKTTIEFPVMGFDVVLMGRYPHRKRGIFSDYSHEDREIAWNSLCATDATALASKLANTLSGGEMSLLTIARAITQEPRILLADESTASLDPRRKLQVFELLSGLNQDGGLTVVAVMHDINLAALFCDRLIFLKQGAVVLEGPTIEVLTPEHIHYVFGVDAQVVLHPRRKRPQVLLG